MSLIVEALKKTQSALNPNQERHTTQPSTPTEPPPFRMAFSQTKKHPEFVNRGTLSIVVLLLFTVLIIIMPHTLIDRVATRDINFYSELLHKISINKVQQPVAIPKPTPVIHFKLDGTLQMNGQHVALINHHLYYVGQMIGDFQIKRIQYNSVDPFNQKTQQHIVLTPELTQ